MIHDLCLPGVGCAGSSITGDAAGAVIGALTDEVVQAARWLIGEAVYFVLDSPGPTVDGGGITTELDLMKKVALLVVLPLLCAATIGPVLRQDGRRLMRVWGVGLPVAIFSGLLVSQLTQQALAVTDDLCSMFVSGSEGTITTDLVAVMSPKDLASMPLGVQAMLAGLGIAGALMLWLEMVVRSAGVYVAVFFMPLALVAFIWPTTAHITKRAVEMLVALILSKFVIVATLSLGLALIAGSGPAAVLSGCAILLIAAFAPFLLFRMTPVIEAAAIAHLEGLSRAPFRTAASAASMATGHPAVQMVMSAASKSGAGGAGVGAAEPLLHQVPDATPDYVPPDHDG